MLQEAMYRDPHSNVEAFRVVLDLVRKRSLAGAELAIQLLAERDEATVNALARRKSR